MTDSHQALAKRHHILPQRYQQGFSTEADGKVWVHSRRDDTVELRTPLNTAVRRHFYSRVADDGSKDAALEKFLAEKVEGPVWPVLDALDGGQIPNGANLVKLAVFVGYLLVRTPEYRRSAAEGSRETLRTIIRDADPDDDAAVDDVVLRMRLLDLGDFDRESVRQEIRRAQRPDWFSQNDSLRSLLKVGHDVVEILRTLDVHIHTAPADEPFVTTDNPMLLLNGTYAGEDFGVATPGVFKFVPLTKKTAVSYGSPGDLFTWTNLDVARARRLNVDLASRCDDQILGASHAHVSAIASASRSPWESRMPRFPGAVPA